MTRFDADYARALAAHLQQESESSLSDAYDLGRRALGQGLGILDLLEMYETMIKQLVLSAPATEQAALMSGVGNFFRELLSPYEMSFRGYREANVELERLNQDLGEAYAELKVQQGQLIQSAKMASLGELVAGIAHELNNPLAFILSHLGTTFTIVQKLESDLEPLPGHARERFSKARDRLQESLAGGERIRELVLKLRTFSRIDEGEYKAVSISECVLSVLKILEHRYHDRLGLQTHFGLPDLVECFPSLLNQAIMNLVANAIDASDDGGEIMITTGADGSDFVIVVADRGHGIPDELRARVLEPFFTTKPIGQGTGLGLSITYSIVQKHRGRLELVPRPGGGTEASIRFPLGGVAV